MEDPRIRARAPKRTFGLLALVSLALGAAALPETARAEDLLVLSDQNSLLMIDSERPQALRGNVPIVNMLPTERILAIDIRPGDEVLYGLSDLNQLFRIDPTTGVATLVATLSQAPAASPFGIDFEPGTRTLRLVNEADQNQRITPETAGSVFEAVLTYDPIGGNAGRNPQIPAIAHNRNRSGSVDSILYGIDSALDELVTIDPPASGVIRRIGRLGVDASAPIGFDIAGRADRAWMTLNVGGQSGLYSIELATGHVAFLGSIGTGLPVFDLVILPLVPEPLEIDRITIKLNFKKSGKDKLQLRGTIQRPAGDLGDTEVTLDFGGIERSFTLGADGSDTDRGDTFKLLGPAGEGRVTYDIKLKKGDFVPELADDGMDGQVDAKKQARNLLVRMTVGDITYEMVTGVEYTAKAGKNGIAKKR